MCSAIDAGLSFLCAVQANDGSWCDWHLPPGESRAWPTAYVGWRLSSLPPRWRPRIDDALARAAAWLVGAEHSDGGWGFAPSTGPDADTTALASLFLGSRGVRAPRATRVLLAHQQSDGGFATYTRGWNHGAWTVSHPEITAVAATALRDETSTPSAALAAAAQYLRSVRGPDGLWPSYWWTSPLYATEMAIAAAMVGAGEDAAVARAVRVVPAPTVFERALQVLCLCRLRRVEPVPPLADMLAAAQLVDGSWPSDPILRLTHRHIDRPWTAGVGTDLGPLYADERRVFTTATAVAALASACPSTPLPR